MLFKKQAVHDAWAATERTLDFKVAVKGEEYTATDISSLSYDSGAMNGESLTLGSTYTNTIKITFSHLIEGLALLDEITPQIGIQLPDGTWDFTSLGVFIIDAEVQQDRNNNTTTLSASDRMCMMGGTYESKLSYPAAINDVAVEIANMAGMKVNVDDFARLPTEKILSLGKVTYRDAIGYVAQFAGGFATFDRDGLLDIRVLSDPDFTVTPDQYQSKGLTKNEAFYRIGGLTCSVTTTVKDDSGSETQETTTLQAGSTAGTQIILNNPGMTQTLLDGLYEQLQDLNFYPFSLSWFGDPSLEAGDWITVQDTAGNEFKTPNLLYSLTFGGGVTATSKADTTITASANFVYRGATNQIITNIRRYLNAAGHAISEGIDEPTSPKAGDIWFKKEGPDTTIMTYVIDPETGVGSWHEGPSTKVNAELQKLFEDLKEEMENTSAAASAAAIAGSAAMVAGNQASAAGSAAQSAANSVAAKVVESSKEVAAAKSAANSAVNQANLAISQAGFANDAADQAKTAAANAQGDAANAQTKADSAVASALNAQSDASDAVTQASSAAADATTAKGQADNALGQANIAINNAANVLDKFNNMQVGSTNLLTGTSGPFVMGFGIPDTTWDETNQASELSLPVELTAEEVLPQGTGFPYTYIPGVTYTQSIYISTDAPLTGTPISFTWYTDYYEHNTRGSDNLVKVSTNVYRAISTYTWPSSNSPARGFNADLYNLVEVFDFTKGTFLQFYKPKLEHGNKATDWSPAPEDVQQQFTDINGELSQKVSQTTYNTLAGTVDTVSTLAKQNQSTISTLATKTSVDTVNHTATAAKTLAQQNATELLNKANSTTVDTLTQRVTTAESTLSQTATKAELALTQNDVNDLDDTVTTQGTDITAMADGLKLKADITTVDTLTQTVNKQDSQLALTATKAELQVAQTNVDNLKKTVTSNTAGMTANANALKLKADSSTVSDLDGRVTSLSGQLDVQSDLISAKVTASDVTGMLNGYATQSWSQGQISAAKNEISASVETVQTQVDNSAVGTNLLTGTSNVLTTVTNATGWGDTLPVYHPAETLKANQTYTVSCYLEPAEHDATICMNTAHGNIMGTVITAGSKGISTLTITLTQEDAGVASNFWISFKNFQTDNSTVSFRGFKLEKGSKATDWCPAPEDQATVDWTKSQLDITDKKITAGITTVTNTLNNTIASATAGMATTTWTNTQIDAAKTAINLSVEQSITTSENTLNSNIDNATKDMATQTWTKGQLSVTDGSISASVQKLHDAVTGEITTATTDMATKSWTQGKLDLTDSSLTSTISSISVGGTNLLLNTATETGVMWLTPGNNLTTEKLNGCNVETQIGDWQSARYALTDLTARNVINITDDFVFSAMLRVAPTLKDNPAHIQFFSAATDKDDTTIGYIKDYADGYWHQISVVFKFLTTPANADAYTQSLRFELGGSNGATVYWTQRQLEKGNKATAWSPAPEDQATVADVSSQITQLQNEINLRVKTGDLVSQISVNVKGILLDGASTYITNTTHIDTGVIKSANIQDAAITSAKIGALAVTTANIGYAAVTNAEIAALAVGTAQIADGAITNAKIGNASITTAKIGDAQISSAKIISISADKITAGTLDAAKVNVVNLNASNITTGTISGANLSINLTTGKILFQKGAIRSTNGNLNIDIDNGNMEVVNSVGSGFRFQNGGLYLTDKSWSWPTPTYGSITYSPKLFSNMYGIAIKGATGASLSSNDYDAASLMWQRQPTSGAAVSLMSNDALLNARERAAVEGGNLYGENTYFPNTSRATIIIGGNNGDGEGATDQYGMYHSQDSTGVGSDAYIKGNRITLQGGDQNGLSDLNLGNDGKGFISSTTIYNRTYSSGDHVVITGWGTLGRLTSARKYKIADTPALDVIDKAKRVLDIKPAEWYDKAEVESIANAITTGGEPMIDAKLEKHYGFIADDFDAAGLTEVVLYKDGEVDSLAYDRIPMYHNVILTDHEKRIAELEAEVKQLKGEI